MSSSTSSPSQKHSSLSRLFRKQQQPEPAQPYAQTNDSNATLVSSTPLKPKVSAPRDYEAVFGDLSSTYGYGVSLPSPSSSTLPASPKKTMPSRTPASHTPSPPSYQSALGGLASTYVAGVGVPALPSLGSSTKAPSASAPPVPMSKKDKVFVDLATKYGMGGAAPTRVWL